MLQRYLLLWLVGLSLIAAYWPAVFEDPFLLSKPFLGQMVMLIMFSIGAILPVDEVKDVLSRWYMILGGTAVQYLSMPALAWGVTQLFPMDESTRLGVILAGCVPGAMASNVLTMAAKGNVSYSVGLTTSATLLSPLVVPLALWVTLGAQASPQLLLDSAQWLAVQVVLPTVTGFLLSRFSDRFARAAEYSAETIANLTILWVIAVVVAANRGSLRELPVQLVSALLLLNLSGYLAGATGGWLLSLNSGMRRALILEVGMQNAGAGVALASALFPHQSGVALPCGLYAFGCMLTGTLLAQTLGRFPPKVRFAKQCESKPEPSLETGIDP